MNCECVNSPVAEHATGENQKIIDCLKSYLQNMPLQLKETRQALDVLGFYKYEYNKKMEYLVRAKKQLDSERLKSRHLAELQNNSSDCCIQPF